METKSNKEEGVKHITVIFKKSIYYNFNSEQVKGGLKHCKFREQL